MEIIYFKDPKAESSITALFKASRLIPFFGSGFTKDCRAKNGRVPDAEKLVAHIKSVAVSNREPNPDDLEQINSITTLKNAFSLMSMPEYVFPAQSRALLGNLFSNTVISEKNKNDLLRLDWPHIFTFNIDDGIERSTGRYKVLHPNKDVSREFIAANTCLFKIHGDISEYIKYSDPNLIFTWRDYAHSLESNRAMLTFLADEARNSAFLFIGCSLDAEIDLLFLSKGTPFSRSLFLKRGKPSLNERITLSEYGIEQVIYFDSYDEIYQWLNSTLKDIPREPPFRGLSFEDAPLKNDEAKNIIANGGPLSYLEDGVRIARLSPSFASRSAALEAGRKLRQHECLLITGRRFSGKTLFLFQTIDSLKEFSSTFYSSTDKFDPSLSRQLKALKNHIFIFDSNYLNAQSLDEILSTKIQANSKLIICSSLGDAELFRFKLEDRSVNFHEIKLSNTLNNEESTQFNRFLAGEGLPIYAKTENLLTFAYRYHNEFGEKLKSSNLFSKILDNNSYSIMILIAAFGKAESCQVNSFSKHFDIGAFINSNDRIFELESSHGDSEYVLVCNSSAWLINTLGNFIHRNPAAVSIIANIIESLARDGFLEASRALIRFDKLNELGGGNNVHKFIKDVYIAISSTYSDDLHYWLQRAKSELISARSIEELNEGMGYASKVRLDSGAIKNQTYYSATLVAAQLNARAYKISNNKENLKKFLDYCLESIRNHENNQRHINKMTSNPAADVKYALHALNDSSIIDLLPRKKEISELTNFFKLNR